MTQAYLEVKFNSLAAETRLIRRKERAKAKELKRAKTSASRLDAELTLWGLQHHRIHVVRPETRATHLALGFLRGKPYRAIEWFAYTEPNWERVRELVLKYGDGDPRELSQKFAQWEDEAKDWYRPPAPIIEKEDIPDVWTNIVTALAKFNFLAV